MCLANTTGTKAAGPQRQPGDVIILALVREELPALDGRHFGENGTAPLGGALGPILRHSRGLLRCFTFRQPSGKQLMASPFTNLPYAVLDTLATFGNNGAALSPALVQLGPTGDSRFRCCSRAPPASQVPQGPTGRSGGTGPTGFTGWTGGAGANWRSHRPDGRHGQSLGRQDAQGPRASLDPLADLRGT